MIMVMMILLLWFGHGVITTVSRSCSRRMRRAGLAMMSGVIQNTIQQNRTDTCRKRYLLTCRSSRRRERKRERGEGRGRGRGGRGRGSYREEG